MLNIKVVGSGCPTCQKLADMCREIADEKKMDVTIEKITDINKFVDYGVFLTPGLLLNDKLVSSGKLPTRSTLGHWLKDAAKE